MIHQFEETLSKIAKFGLLTEFEEKQKDEFLLFVEQKIKPETDYIKFLMEFNRITSKKYIGDIESRNLFYEHEAIYSQTERIQALTNALTDPYIKDNIGILTPKYILRPDNLAKYISYTPPKTSNNGQPKTKIKNGDYTEVQDF
jgi:hypothetical protein